MTPRQALACVRKVQVYAAGVASALLSYGVLDGQSRTVALVVIAVATGGGIFKAKNADKPTNGS